MKKLQKLKNKRFQIAPEHKGSITEQEVREGFNELLEKIVKEKGENWFESSSDEEIKEAITKVDIRTLIGQGAIYKVPPKGTSRVRARKIKKQKVKGRQKGHGSRKGKKTARTPSKKLWINKVRLQRKLLRTMKENKLLNPKTFRMLYNKSRGGFFRSKRHIKLYIDEHKLVENKK